MHYCSLLQLAYPSLLTAHPSKCCKDFCIKPNGFIETVAFNDRHQPDIEPVTTKIGSPKKETIMGNMPIMRAQYRALYHQYQTPHEEHEPRSQVY